MINRYIFPDGTKLKAKNDPSLEVVVLSTSIIDEDRHYYKKGTPVTVTVEVVTAGNTHQYRFATVGRHFQYGYEYTNIHNYFEEV
jgi:hypothetical protein